MTVDENTTWLEMLCSVWQRIKSNRIVRIIIWARWLLTLGAFVGTLLWYAYLEGQGISANLTTDYAAVQTAQGTLINDTLTLIEDLQNPKVQLPLDSELEELRTKAKKTISALAGLRAPTSYIEEAQREYRAALETLIGVSNRLERGELDQMALPLHNGLQRVANAGGALNTSVGHFQGGMWPQLFGSVF